MARPSSLSLAVISALTGSMHVHSAGTYTSCDNALRGRGSGHARETITLTFIVNYAIAIATARHADSTADLLTK